MPDSGRLQIFRIITFALEIFVFFPLIVSSVKYQSFRQKKDLHVSFSAMIFTGKSNKTSKCLIRKLTKSPNRYKFDKIEVPLE